MARVARVPIFLALEVPASIFKGVVRRLLKDEANFRLHIAMRGAPPDRLLKKWVTICPVSPVRFSALQANHGRVLLIS